TTPTTSPPRRCRFGTSSSAGLGRSTTSGYSRAFARAGTNRARPVGARDLSAWRRRLREPVAGARFGEDVKRARGVRLELASQLRHVDVEVVRLLAVAPPPHLAQQHLVREELAGVAGEDAEQAELVRGELDCLTAERDGALLKVDPQVAEHD